ncbi:hypothetical protein K7X08_001789 [Anisodus acutangulus]|uniref:DUF4408 domain-containing protein n=1 Tax=Anisodus acutangulus TaxID=402998 RepID=A0A9Q1LN09_9SOLA|nr:hypothetical protein K7X08_001789 [Anisodus acutangulus]
MDNEVFDNVKFEKAKAIASYNRFQNMMKMLQIFEVLVAVVLISWSWTRIPAAVKLSGQFFVQFSAYLFKPHVVFLIGNAIIVTIVVLCRQNDTGNNNSDTNDIHAEEINNTEVQRPIVTTACGGDVSEMAEPTVATTEDKKIIFSEYEVRECQLSIVSKLLPVFQPFDNQSCSLMDDHCEPDSIEFDSNDVATAIDTATKQIQKFKRTQSEKLKRQITANPRRELRRSETDMRRIVSKSTVPVDAVDTLNNEEFRLTIEAFIKKNQIFFEKQRLAETEPEKYEQIGIEAF